MPNFASTTNKIIKATPAQKEELSPLAIRKIREKIGYGKKEMATFLGAGYSTYRSWEDEKSHTHKNMSGAARTLLKICAVNPAFVKEALEQYKLTTV